MQPLFWMGNHLASELVEVSSDLESLRRPGFWVVLGSFEGKWRLARFAKVEQQNFPKVGLNYIDVYHRAGTYTLPLPTGIGLEAAGVIEEVKEDANVRENLKSKVDAILGKFEW